MWLKIKFKDFYRKTGKEVHRLANIFMKYDNIHCLFQISSEKSFTKVQKTVKPTYLTPKEYLVQCFFIQRRKKTGSV